MKIDKCPVYQAAGERIVHKGEGCNDCYFRDNCPFDKIDKAVIEVLKDMGDYVHGKW